MLFNALRGGINITEALAFIISSLIVVFLTLPVHEFAHGFVATKLGDPTPKWQGRLTLNPLMHIDWLGALCILVFGFGWAKPVSVDMRNFKRPKTDMALVAAAGPVANLLLALISLIIANLIALVNTSFQIIFYIELICYFVAQINVYLAVFNLIPVPPLDGSRILSVFLPKRTYYKIMQYERYIVIAVFVLIYTGVLSRPLSAISSAVMSLLSNIASLPFVLI